MLCLELGKSEAASLATMAVCDGGRAPGDYTFRDLDARPGVHARAKRPGGVGPRAPTGPRAFLAANRLRTRTRLGESDSRLAIYIYTYESLQGERAGERTKWSSRRREVLPDSSRVGPLPDKGHAEALAELGQVAADGK